MRWPWASSIRPPGTETGKVTPPWWESVACDCDPRPTSHILVIKSGQGLALRYQVGADQGHQLVRRIADRRFGLDWSSEFIVSPHLEFTTLDGVVSTLDVREAPVTELLPVFDYLPADFDG